MPSLPRPALRSPALSRPPRSIRSASLGAALVLVALAACPQRVEAPAPPQPPNPRAGGVKPGESGHCFRLREEAEAFVRAAEKAEAHQTAPALAHAARLAAEGLAECSPEQLEAARKARNRLLRLSLGASAAPPEAGSLVVDERLLPAPARPGYAALAIPDVAAADGRAAARQLFRQTAEVLVAAGAAAVLTPAEYLARKRALEDVWPVALEPGHEQVEALFGVGRATEGEDRLDDKPAVRALLDQRRRHLVRWWVQEAQRPVVASAGHAAEATALGRVAVGDDLGKLARALAEVGSGLEGSDEVGGPGRAAHGMVRESLSFLQALSTSGAPRGQDRLAAGVVVASLRAWAALYGEGAAVALLDGVLDAERAFAAAVAKRLLPSARTVSDVLSSGRTESPFLRAVRRNFVNAHPELEARLDVAWMAGTWGADPLVLAERQGIALLARLAEALDVAGDPARAGQLARFAAAGAPDGATLPGVLSAVDAPPAPGAARGPATAELQQRILQTAGRVLRRLDPARQGERFGWDAQDLAGQALFYRTPWQPDGEPGLLVDWKGEEALHQYWELRPGDALGLELGEERARALEQAWVDGEVATFRVLCDRARQIAGDPPRHLRVFPGKDPRAQRLVVAGLHPFPAGLLGAQTGEEAVVLERLDRLRLGGPDDDDALLFAAAHLAVRALDPFAPAVHDAASAEQALAALDELPRPVGERPRAGARGPTAAALALARRASERPLRSDGYLDLRPFAEMERILHGLPGLYDRRNPTSFVDRLLAAAGR